ncbi:MAG: hypothetical protein QOH48_2533 [Actinomycetota bacterium]|nr:hypothetical protein [Actinomycetota bacterium]
MTSTPGDGTSDPQNIIRLRAEPLRSEPAPKPKRLGRLHSTATGGMALCAFLGIFSLLALITVRWPGNTNRYAVGLLLFAGLGFLLCGSIAVFSAARDTYAHRGSAVYDEEE